MSMIIFHLLIRQVIIHIDELFSLYNRTNYSRMSQDEKSSVPHQQRVKLCQNFVMVPADYMRL